MKTFYTDGTGSQQTLNNSQTEKVVVYDTINDAEADLANLAEGQIIATKDDDFEGNAVPVNEVALNNMHSVTSNAVAEALGYLVWENPDTTASFEAQTIAFDRAVPSSYSRIKIEYRCLNSESYYKTTEVEVGNNTYLENSYAVLTSSRWVIADRLVKNTTRNGCDFSEARLYTNTTNFDTANTRLIPARIWAIK